MAWLSQIWKSDYSEQISIEAAKLQIVADYAGFQNKVSQQKLKDRLILEEWRVQDLLTAMSAPFTGAFVPFSALDIPC